MPKLASMARVSVISAVTSLAVNTLSRDDYGVYPRLQVLLGAELTMIVAEKLSSEAINALNILKLYTRFHAQVLQHHPESFLIVDDPVAPLAGRFVVRH